VQSSYLAGGDESLDGGPVLGELLHKVDLLLHDPTEGLRRDQQNYTLTHIDSEDLLLQRVLRLALRESTFLSNNTPATEEEIDKHCLADQGAHQWTDSSQPASYLTN
jgi:hypothetical protein